MKYFLRKFYVLNIRHVHPKIKQIKHVRYVYKPSLLWTCSKNLSLSLTENIHGLLREKLMSKVVATLSASYKSLPDRCLIMGSCANIG